MPAALRSYFKFYMHDYNESEFVAGLDWVEERIYFTLLRKSYGEADGSISADRVVLRRILGSPPSYVTQEMFDAALEKVLAAFDPVENCVQKRLRQERVALEIGMIDDVSDEREKAGARGGVKSGQARRKRLLKQMLRKKRGEGKQVLSGSEPIANIPRPVPIPEPSPQPPPRSEPNQNQDLDLAKASRGLSTSGPGQVKPGANRAENQAPGARAEAAPGAAGDANPARVLFDGKCAAALARPNCPNDERWPWLGEPWAKWYRDLPAGFERDMTRESFTRLYGFKPEYGPSAPRSGERPAGESADPGSSPASPVDAHEDGVPA